MSDSRRRRALIFAGGALTGLAAGLLLGLWFVWAHAQYLIPGFGGQFERPAVLEEAGIRVAARGLTKNSIAITPSVGPITDIVTGARAAAFGAHMLLAGSEGALVLDETFQSGKAIAFSGKLTHVDVVDVDDSQCLQHILRVAQTVPVLRVQVRHLIEFHVPRIRLRGAETIAPLVPQSAHHLRHPVEFQLRPFAQQRNILQPRT